MKYISIFLLSLLFSCTFNTSRENREEDKKDAEKITQKFFNLIKENNREQAFKLFSNKFFQATSRDKLNQMIDLIQKEGGNISEYSLSDWETNVVKGTNPKSNYVLIYDAKRNKINTQEILFLEKENNEIKITGYKVNFDIPIK